MDDGNKFTVALKWLGTVLTLVGAALTSLDVQPWNIWFLNLGSMIFIWWSFRIRDAAMITVNVGLTTIYFVGVVIRWTG